MNEPQMLESYVSMYTQCDRKLAQKYLLSKHKHFGVRYKCDQRDNGTLKGSPTP